jgi:HrpA-like RNA helicase
MTVADLGLYGDLPIVDYKQPILDAVDANQVTILTAETGAGKSTQVPQYLAEHGYEKVIVTQPRILAARNLSRRVREEWAARNVEVADKIIGYRTAHERDDDPDTVILYCTDGLQLVRELTGSGLRERQVLILDEVHEWNENMEVLVAWARKRCQEDPYFKVLIMSATIETDSLAEFFVTNAVINVPGRSYEVSKRHGTDVVSEIVGLLKTQHSNMLVFLPGKAEIESVATAIKTQALAAGVPVLPLHSQLDVEEQQKAFASYPNGKVILSTNIAQTSVTIDDIDAVIDSGLERRSEVRNGVEGLFISQVSQADCLQRAGRAGRTKPGQYILAPLDDMPCKQLSERNAYAVPEILRKHIDRLTLRLANVGIDIETLNFYHDPSLGAIRRAKQTLVSLGALTPRNEVTSIGRIMEQFPVESSYARMLVEAQKYSKGVQQKLAAIIAIQEVGGIVKGGTRYTGWKRYSKQSKSDLLAQYEVFLALPEVLPEEYDDLGIIGKNVTKAREVMERLEYDIAHHPEVLTPIDATEQDQLLRCIVAGQIDQLWSVDMHGEAVHLTKKTKRELSSSTVVVNPRLVAGTPFDLQIPTQSGGLETLHLVQGVTKVEAKWLTALAPDIFKARPSKVYFDSHRGALAMRQMIRIGGKTIEAESEPLTDNSPRYRRMFSEAYAAWVYEQLEDERRRLKNGQLKRIPSVAYKQVMQKVKTVLNGAISIDELSPRERKELEQLSKLETYLGANFIAKLHAQRERRAGEDSSQRTWQPRHKRKLKFHRQRYRE